MDAIATLLAGRYCDPEDGRALSVPTRVVVIAESLAWQEDVLVGELGLGRRLAVVSDPATHEVMGKRVERALTAVAAVQSLILSDRPSATMAAVEQLAAASATADALVAVGSGTINDLCKYTAARAGKPYAVFGTAPSMNGYTSVNAAITVAGHKKSLNAAAPAGVFLDLSVLAAAPPRLIRAGLGDSLCRPTAQADWLLAHLLLDRPYRELPFALLAEDEPALFADSEALLAGDLAAMARLVRTLVLSGFGMTLCGGSHPASQGEHLISHYIEMMAPDLPQSFHGEQIGVTTLTMARLYDCLLAGGTPQVSESRLTETEFIEHFGAELGSACWAEFTAKRLGVAGAEALNQRLQASWSTVVSRLTSVLRTADELEQVLEAVGAPTRPERLHWPAASYRQAIRRARQIRNRYTALDLAADAGLLDGFARSATKGMGTSHHG